MHSWTRPRDWTTVTQGELTAWRHSSASVCGSCSEDPQIPSLFPPKNCLSELLTLIPTYCREITFQKWNCWGWCQNLGSLCPNVKQQYGDRVTEKSGFITWLGKGEHSRLAPQDHLLPPIPLVIRERSHSQAGECDQDRGSHSRHSFFCKVSLFTHLFAVKRWDWMPWS